MKIAHDGREMYGPPSPDLTNLPDRTRRPSPHDTSSRRGSVPIPCRGRAPDDYDLRELYEQTLLDISPDKGTEYPCTQRDLDDCGGNSRRAYTTRLERQVDSAPPKKRESMLAELRDELFSQPNKGEKISVRAATLEIFEFNALDRPLSDKENEAKDRLVAMHDKARDGVWGPDLVIKCFRDFDTLFFQGKLTGHVCVTWARQPHFDPETWGHTAPVGKGKAIIRMNADAIFYKYHEHGHNPFNQMMRTLVHEMW